MTRETLRKWTVWYVYASIAAHLAVGMLLPLIMPARRCSTATTAPSKPHSGARQFHPRRAQQVWWISLFGPTVQAAAVWMAALAWMGDRQRNALAWGALIA
ncbi:hypothetical protein LP419_29705 [Massilia sp. H-1]|nr:hypothetical protein LP419_29705 [Massilia sp. H-1]